MSVLDSICTYAPSFHHVFSSRHHIRLLQQGCLAEVVLVIQEQTGEKYNQDYAVDYVTSYLRCKIPKLVFIQVEVNNQRRLNVKSIPDMPISSTMKNLSFKKLVMGNIYVNKVQVLFSEFFSIRYNLKRLQEGIFFLSLEKSPA